MTKNLNNVAANPLFMTASGNIKSWGLIYDKYAPVIYGIICRLTNDKVMAEEIFKAAFLDLKDNHALLNVNVALYPALMRYVHAFTKKQLELHGITLHINKTSAKEPLINLLCTKCNSLKEAADIYNITEAETQKKIRVEFSQLRNQKLNRKAC